MVLSRDLASEERALLSSEDLPERARLRRRTRKQRPLVRADSVGVQILSSPNRDYPASRGGRTRTKPFGSEAPRVRPMSATNKGPVCCTVLIGPPQLPNTEAMQLLRLRGFCVFSLTHSNCVQNASMVFERPCGDSQVALVDDVVAVEDRSGVPTCASRRIPGCPPSARG